MTTLSLYPPGPSQVPADVTRLDNAYRSRVFAVFAGLFVFLLLYVSLVALSIWGTWWLIRAPMPVHVGGRATFWILAIKFGGAAAAGLLSLFLFKGLFKGERARKDSYVELKEQDHPRLFEFIRRVYTDVGAPPPRRVYASAEVNAAVIYSTSLLNLLIPPRKDLLIGLGLVNVLTLSEFKAVLAHEFGHFAQRSGRLGSYVVVANRVMYDLVYSRDALDRLVDQWSRVDVRFSFPAWILKGVLWVVRKVLGGLYRLINLLHLSLGRQMEYNADNVAVSVTGSDALINGLCRTEFATLCLQHAGQALDEAADHGLFTDDLFLHQDRAAQWIRAQQKDDQLGLPPTPPGPGRPAQVFEPVDDGIPDRYRTHPTLHMREKNAKRCYLPHAGDDRPAWLLFGNGAALRQQVTGRFYRFELDRREAYQPRPAHDVQQFIDAEQAETTFDPVYHGFYDDRMIDPKMDQLPADPPPLAEVSAWLRAWPGQDIEQKTKSYRTLQSEIELLGGLLRGEYTLKGKTFPFREREYTARQVQGLYDQVEKEIQAERSNLHVLDHQVLLAHWALARAQSGPLRSIEQELLSRYRFHMDLQGLFQSLLDAEAQLRALFDFLSQKAGSLAQNDFAAVREQLVQCKQTVDATLTRAASLTTPALSNVPADTPLLTLVIDRGQTQLPPLPAESIPGDWMMALAGRLAGVLKRVRRVHFKSLGGLLSFQENLVAQWQSSPPPAAD